MNQRVLLFGAFVAFAEVAAAEEWPRFRGPRGDGISRDTIAEKWPAKLREVWRAPVGAGYASPIGWDGKVYVFSLVDDKRETLTAYAAGTGKIVWSNSTDGGFSDSYSGTRASPAVDPDPASPAIYTFGGLGDLTRREIATGKPVWRINVLRETGAKNPQWGTASNPLLDGDRIYVQGGSGGSVALAVDKSTGHVAWKSAFQGESGYAAPILVEVASKRQLIVFAGDTLVGMDPATGATLWSEKWQTRYGVNAATPIYRNGLLFVTSAYNHGSLMLKLDAAGAHRLWETDVAKSRFNAPILDGDYLYDNSEGVLECLSFADGKVKWSAKRGDFDLGIGGSLIRSGDKLILLGERGLLSLARATPAGVVKLAEQQLFDGSENWSTPLVYRGRLYVRSPSTLLSLELPASATN